MNTFRKSGFSHLCPCPGSFVLRTGILTAVLLLPALVLGGFLEAQTPEGDAVGDRADRGAQLIGLVELPGLFGTPDPDGPPGALLPGDSAPVPLHAEPDAGSRRIATLSTADALEWREFSYEAPAAMAYGVADGWVRVAFGEGEARQYGWVPPGHRGPLHPLGALLQDGLSYMTSDWNGLLHDTPSTASATSRQKREGHDDPVDMNVLQVVESEGATWLRVALLEPGRCGIARTPAVQATGWVPALAEDGRPNAWFYSRGC